MGGIGKRYRFGKGKALLVKSHMAKNIKTFGLYIKASIAMVRDIVSKKHTRCRAELHFLFIVREKLRKTLTPKNSKKKVVRRMVKDKFKG